MISANFFILAAGIVMLLAGAEFLVRGASSIALKFGMSPLTIGLTVVAVGTSSPELFVGIQGAIAGKGSISLGSAIGSNICNIALILGVAAWIANVKSSSRIVNKEIPIMILSSILLLIFCLDPKVDRLDGFVLTAGLLIYLIYTLKTSNEDQGDIENIPERPLFKCFAMVASGIVGLAIGSSYIVEGATGIASTFSIPEGVIALTVVAIGTSLPELATTFSAARQGNADLAVGNVVGSNIFNSMGIVGIPALINPLSTNGIRITEILFMVCLTVFILPLVKSDGKLCKKEGAFLLTVFAVYNMLLFY